MIIDTHVHFNHADLAADLPNVLARAEAAGVGSFCVVGYDIPSSALAVSQAEADDRIFAIVGVHPHDAAHWNADAAARIEDWLAHPRVVALGEIGLDFYRDLSPRDAQYAAFRAQIGIARAANAPIVIHCRDAYPETMDLLEAEATDLRVLLHCFAGDLEHAARAWKRNWLLGVGGSVTFKANEALREIVRVAPPESLVLETDAPYLSPMPLRGKFPNEPARLVHVVEKLAELRVTSAAEIESTTTENARRFFGLA